jgi:pimeloyl-ACP methyl ester carboxylesterase
MAETGRSLTRVRGFDDAEMDYQLLRGLGTVATGGAAIGEMLHIAATVTDGDPDSWTESFAAAAMRLQSAGEKAAAAEHRVSARNYFFRANQSFRAAEFWAHPPDRMRQFGLAARECFIRAATLATELGNFDFRLIEFPYENGTAIPGYAFTPKTPGKQTCTLVMMNGSDGTAEEVWFWAGCEAVERGYTVILIDGPGQTGMMRLVPNTTFRPDTEVPLGAVIDHLRTTNLPCDRIVLFGFSFGGYMVTRAAAKLDGIAALIASPPLLDLPSTLGNLITRDGELHLDCDYRLDELDQVPGMSPVFRRDVEIHCRKFGVATLQALLDCLPEYAIDAALLHNIRCPSLALVGAGEGAAFMHLARQFTETIEGPATFHEFNVETGAEAHCQVGNPAELTAVAFDWLDETFARGII